MFHLIQCASARVLILAAIQSQKTFLKNVNSSKIHSDFCVVYGFPSY